MAWASAGAGTGYLRAGLTRAGQEHHNTAIIPVQGDQPAGVQGHARHQAAGCVPVPSTLSAQALSIGELTVGCPQRLSEHGTASRNVIQGDRDGMLHEPGHALAAAFEHAVKQIPARRWLGLTATSTGATSWTT